MGRLLEASLTAVAHLPMSVLYALSDGCYALLYHGVRYRRKLVRRNLTRAYPTKSEKEIRQVEKGFYRHLCHYVVETVKLLHITDEEMRQRLEFRNIELMERLREDGKPLFVYLGHYGNWEFVTSITLWCQPGLEACQVYHPLSSKGMDRLMLKLRGRFRSTGIAQSDTFKTLLRMKNEGRQPMVGLIADQRPLRRHHEVWTSFMRQPTAIITGSERIGRRMDAHFVYADMEVVSRGHYAITLREMVPDPTDEFSISKEYMHLLEQTIDRAPQYYLWSHNRWKYRPDENGNAVFNN